MKTLRILNHKGDEVLTWEQDTTEAEQRFEDLKADGYTFHKYNTEGDPDEVVLQANGIVNKFKQIQDGEAVLAMPRRVGG